MKLLDIVSMNSNRHWGGMGKYISYSWISKNPKIEFDSINQSHSICFFQLNQLGSLKCEWNLFSTGPLIQKAWKIWLFRFSRFWIFRKKNINTEKINNINYMLRYALAYFNKSLPICFSWKTEKSLKSGVVWPSSSKKHTKSYNLCHQLIK